MTTFKESFSTTKFDLYFRLELVTVADSFQDLGEMELPSLAIERNGLSDNQFDLSDHKKRLHFWFSELEETLKEKETIESSLQEYKDKMPPNEQKSLDSWLINLYDELKMSQLQQEAEMRRAKLRRSIILAEERTTDMLEQTNMEDNALTVK